VKIMRRRGQTDEETREEKNGKKNGKRECFRDASHARNSITDGSPARRGIDRQVSTRESRGAKSDGMLGKPESVDYTGVVVRRSARCVQRAL
jgi:hypothetical protein